MMKCKRTVEVLSDTIYSAYSGDSPKTLHLIHCSNYHASPRVLKEEEMRSARLCLG